MPHEEISSCGKQSQYDNQIAIHKFKKYPTSIPQVETDLIKVNLFAYLIVNICFHLPRRRRPGTGDIATPPVRLSICLSIRPSVRHV